MGNRFSIEIIVGGDLPDAEIPAFYAAITAEGVSYDWDAGPFASDADDLRAVIEANGEHPLVMRHAAHAGRFETLEAFCVARGLTFVSHSSAGAEADAELRWWFPGLDAVHCRNALEDHSPVATFAEIAAILGSGAAEQQLARLTDWIARQTPPAVPALRLTS